MYLNPILFLAREICVIEELCLRYYESMNRSSEWSPCPISSSYVSWFVLIFCKGIYPPLIAKRSTLCSKTNLARYFKLNSFIFEFLKLINFGIILFPKSSLGKRGWPIIFLKTVGVYKILSFSFNNSTFKSDKFWNLWTGL